MLYSLFGLLVGIVVTRVIILLLADEPILLLGLIQYTGVVCLMLVVISVVINVVRRLWSRYRCGQMR